MQAVIPLLAGSGAVAAGTAATTAATMFSAAAPILGGIGAASAAAGQKQDAKINAFIGKTRAIQTDTTAREGLNSELATIRSTLSANGQGMNVGTNELFKELRGVRGRERRIEFGNEMANSAAYSRQAAAIKPGMELAGGLLKAGPSLFDLYELRKQRK